MYRKFENGRAAPMANYDFSALAPTDFEELCRDLLQRHLGVELQAFTKGRDGGIDLRHAPVSKKKWVVQCKHFVGSTFSTLKSKLKSEELPKLHRIKPKRYILATSLGLSPNRVDELHSLLQPYCLSPHDIISKDDLNGLLREHPDVERSHLKLWVTSEPVLSRVLQNDLFIQSAMTEDEIRRRLGLYVHTDAFGRASKKLERERVCILSGVPGVGKTTLAEMLLVQYMMKDWQLVSIHQNVSEGLRAFRADPKAKQVFYYDDFLGQISSGEKLAKNEDRVLLTLMKGVASMPRKRFILTTREYILAQAKSEHEQLARSDIDLYRFIVDCEEYGEFEKAKILANHLFFFGVPQRHIESLIDGLRYRQIISHPNYSPRIIEWMTSHAETSACKPKDYPQVFVSRLDDPSKLWSHAYGRQLSEASRHLLLTLATCGEAVFMAEFRPIFEDFYSSRTHTLGIPRTPADFEESLNELEGNFIKIHPSGDQRVIQFHNPSILDFLQIELRRCPQEVMELLKAARSFDQIRRIALVFELGLSIKSSTAIGDEHATTLAEAIERMITKPAIEVALVEGSTRTWRKVWRNRWERLRDCIQIANRFSHKLVGECIEKIVTRPFDEPADAAGEMEELLGILDNLSFVTWCHHGKVSRLRTAIREYLLEATEEFDEPLEGIAETLNKPFKYEVQMLNDAISECGPPPDDETPDDWHRYGEADNCHSSIES